MQRSSLTEKLSSVDGAELASAWQLIKHEAASNGTRPRIRFRCESLPAYYHSQVTSVSHNTRQFWIIETSIAALSGSHGVMPRPMYRAALEARFEYSDEAAIDFFNGFNNRYLNLFCQVENKHQIVRLKEEETFTWPTHGTHISELLAKLSGVVGESNVIPQKHFIQYTALLGFKLTCPIALRMMLEDYFEAKFEIDYFDMEHQALTPCSLTRIGRNGQNQKLGKTTLIGKVATMVGQSLKIKICPRNYLHYLEVYSDKKLTLAIDHMVKTYMGINIKYKLYMKVNSRYLPRTRLLSSASNATKLGRSAWMGSQNTSKQFVEMPLAIDPLLQ
ncbi:type VI secretion protein VasB-1 [Parashewanella curva]|uniref:Type VI secretion protein VasB-1 n=1 Tax=Parashewanella curva TaxID=2338552 RepID=A0A3L8Q0Y7_9GAMM|nr:type VI secretion system baseplate subunit TssG [Parashewanella curva]RLV61244.1 type VI secretion protein VasB-1 [Parashewanella curva]